MIIRNNLAKQVKVILNGKEFVFNSGAEIEVSDNEGEFILSLQPMLCVVKEKVIVHSEPAEIEIKEEPKAKKNVVKNKKSRK